MLLVVCTANISRSPAAERMLRVGFGPEASFPVVSAGTRGMLGHPMDKRMAALLEQSGISAADHSANELTAETIGEAELILTMTRTHRSAVLSIDPKARHKTFTLLEFAELTRNSPRNESFESLSTRRATLEVEPEHLDICDPFGLGEVEYFHAFTEMQTAVTEIVTWFTGEQPSLTPVAPPAVTVMSMVDLSSLHESGLVTEPFSWRAASKADYDVLHVHSLGPLVSEPGKFAKLLKKLHKQSVPVVRTRSTTTPPSGFDSLLTQLDELTVGWIDGTVESPADLHRVFAMALPIQHRA